MEKESAADNKPAIKVTIKDYAPRDFCYFDQTSHAGTDISRFIAYTQDAEKVGLLIKNIIHKFSDDLEVLVNVQKNSDKPDEWSKYYCEIEKGTLIEKFNRNNRYIIHDGSNQFCVKDSPSGDYFAFDDHGVLFIYSNDIKYEELLEVMNFERRKDTTIFDTPHSHVILDDSRELLDKLIEDFKLEEV